MNASITFSEMTRAAPDTSFAVGDYVAWDTAHRAGGVQMPAAFASTAEEARAEALALLREQGAKGDDGDIVDGVQLIVADPDEDDA